MDRDLSAEAEQADVDQDNEATPPKTAYWKHVHDLFGLDIYEPLTPEQRAVVRQMAADSRKDIQEFSALVRDRKVNERTATLALAADIARRVEGGETMADLIEEYGISSTHAYRLEPIGSAGISGHEFELDLFAASLKRLAGEAMDALGRKRKKKEDQGDATVEAVKKTRAHVKRVGVPKLCHTVKTCVAGVVAFLEHRTGDTPELAEEVKADLLRALGIHTASGVEEERPQEEEPPREEEADQEEETAEPCEDPGRDSPAGEDEPRRAAEETSQAGSCGEMPEPKDVSEDKLKSVMSKVSKLLSLFEDQPDSPEGHTAHKMARKLMATYRIEMSDLDSLDEHDPMTEHGFAAGKREPWRRDLAYAMATHNGCFSIAYGDHMRLFGRKSAVQVAEHMYQVTSRHLVAAWEAQKARLKANGTKLRGRRDQAAFLGTAVRKIRTRLEEQVAREQKTDPQTWGLMKSDKQAGEQFARDKGHQWSSGRARDVAMSVAGARAGANAPLNSAVSSRGGKGGGLLVG